MGDTGIIAAAVLTWLAAAYKLASLRRGSPAGRALLAALVLLAVGLTVKVGGVYRAVDEAAGRANLAQLLKDGCVVASACATQVLLLHLSRTRGDAGPRVRTRVVVLVLALAAMISFFLVAAPGAEDVKYLSRHGASAGLFEFRLVYLAYLAFAFGDIVRLCTRFARLAGEPLLTLGLRLVAAGGVVGVGYAAVNALSVLAARDGATGRVDALQSLSKGLIVVATLLVVVGSTLPAWGPRVGLRDPGRGRRAQRQAARLEPLWAALREELPDIVLDAPALGGRRGAVAAEVLYRRVIEIEDGRLALRAYLQPGVEEAARLVGVQRGLEGERLDAAVEASQLAGALRAHRSGGRGAGGGSDRAPRVGVADLESEAEWLGAVADAFADREYVDAVLSHARPALIDLTAEMAPHVDAV